jgi:hypothetical protein
MKPQYESDFEKSMPYERVEFDTNQNDLNRWIWYDLEKEMDMEFLCGTPKKPGMVKISRE